MYDKSREEKLLSKMGERWVRCLAGAVVITWRAASTRRSALQFDLKFLRSSAKTWRGGRVKSYVNTALLYFSRSRRNSISCEFCFIWKIVGLTLRAIELLVVVLKIRACELEAVVPVLVMREAMSYSCSFSKSSLRFLICCSVSVTVVR